MLKFLCNSGILLLNCRKYPFMIVIFSVLIEIFINKISFKFCCQQIKDFAMSLAGDKNLQYLFAIWDIFTWLKGSASNF